MPTPIIKPSARIAARQQARPNQLSVRLQKLREVSWSITEICNEVDETMKHVGTAVGANSFLLLQQQRGEIGVMRDLLKANAEFVRETIDDGAMESNARHKAYTLFHKTEEAISMSFKNAGLMK